MRKGTKKMPGKDRNLVIVAVSGGPDSVYLIHRIQKETMSLFLAHFNHQARGKASEEDRKFVEWLSRKIGKPLEVGIPRPQERGEKVSVMDASGRQPGFENKAREERYRFLYETKEKHGAKNILMAHTADDQVETVLMRFFKGAGISGLKGIPRQTEEGIERPLLDTWRKDILAYLKKHKIPFMVDRSNLDTRFERNWVRHVLIPLLETRYGKSFKKRIFILGERFREIDVFIEDKARKWLREHEVKSLGRGVAKEIHGDAVQFPRKAFENIPSVLRMRILQILCFERIGTSPNERLLNSMDRMIVSGSPSARLNLGKGGTLRCRYGEAILTPSWKKATSGAEKAPPMRQGKGEGRKDRGEETRGRARKTGEPEPILQMNGQGKYGWAPTAWQCRGAEEGGRAVLFSWEERGKTAQGWIRKMTGSERQAAFDAERLSVPLSVRPLREGDRVRPFGLTADKKVKEILIERKVPREERWGRPVVCDAGGRIVWIPGVLRSAEAPVTAKTKRTIVLRADAWREPSS